VALGYLKGQRKGGKKKGEGGEKKGEEGGS